MSTKNPNIIDVVAHAQGTTTEDDPTLGVLAFIAAHQEAEANWREDLITTGTARSEGARLLMEHGVQSALSNSEWGGTTRQYEDTLAQIQSVMDTAAAGTSFRNDALQFYIDQCKERPGGMAPLDPKVWPGFKSTRGVRA